MECSTRSWHVGARAGAAREAHPSHACGRLQACSRGYAPGAGARSPTPQSLEGAVCRLPAHERTHPGELGAGAGETQCAGGVAHQSRETLPGYGRAARRDHRQAADEHQHRHGEECVRDDSDRHQQAGETIPRSKLRRGRHAGLDGLLILNLIGLVADLELRPIAHADRKRLAAYRK